MGVTRELGRALEVIRSSSVIWWHNWLVLAALNLAWVVCVATLVLGPPATFGLYRAARQVVRGQEVDVRDLARALRGDFLRSWGWLLVTSGVSLGVLLTVRFYGGLGTGWAVGLGFIALLVGVAWFALQLYVLPYVLEQGTTSLRQGFKNALFTLFAGPVYTFVLACFVGALLLLGTRFVFLFFLGLPCLIAVLGTCAVRERLATFNVRRRDG